MSRSAYLFWKFFVPKLPYKKEQRYPKVQVFSALQNISSAGMHSQQNWKKRPRVRFEPDSSLGHDSSQCPGKSVKGEGLRTRLRGEATHHQNPVAANPAAWVTDSEVEMIRIIVTTFSKVELNWIRDCKFGLPDTRNPGYLGLENPARVFPIPDRVFGYLI